MQKVGRPSKPKKDQVQGNGFTATQSRQIQEEANRRHLPRTALLREAWDLYYAKLCAERAVPGGFDLLPATKQSVLPIP